MGRSPLAGTRFLSGASPPSPPAAVPRQLDAQLLKATPTNSSPPCRGELHGRTPTWSLLLNLKKGLVITQKNGVMDPFLKAHGESRKQIANWWFPLKNAQAHSRIPYWAPAREGQFGKSGGGASKRSKGRLTPNSHGVLPFRVVARGAFKNKHGARPMFTTVTNAWIGTWFSQRVLALNTSGRGSHKKKT